MHAPEGPSKSGGRQEGGKAQVNREATSSGLLEVPAGGMVQGGGGFRLLVPVSSRSSPGPCVLSFNAVGGSRFVPARTL